MMRCMDRDFRRDYDRTSLSKAAKFGLPTLFCALAFLSGFSPATAGEAERFRFSREVDRGAAKNEEILSFTLDSDIYAATRDGLPDLRILDDTQSEAPYQIEPEVEYREEKTRHSGPTEVVSLREEGNAIEVQVRLPKDAQAAEGFTLWSPQVNYQRRVQVFGSDDGAKWSPLVSDGVLFDFSRYMDVSNRDVPLPSNRWRQFKLVIQEVTDEKELPYKDLTRTFRGGKEEERKETTTVQRRVFRIDRIEFYWHTVRQHVKKSKTGEYPVAAFDREMDAQKKQTVLHVRMRREPLTAIAIQTPSRNFYRRATVEVPVVRGAVTEWTAIGHAALSNLHYRNICREQLTISFPEHRQEEYRIVIDNEDNPPLDVTGVKAEGNVYRAIFLAQEGITYRVFSGSETAEPPKYEAATVLATLRESFSPTTVRLGVQVDNASYGGEPGLTIRNLLNNWVFLGAVICLMVVVLAWGLFHAGKRLEELPKD